MASKYQGRVDSLEVLRQTYSENKRAKLKDHYLIFDKDIRLPLNTPTAWVSPLTKKQYDLGSLWLYLEHHLQHVTEYMLRVSELGLVSVTVSDREAVSDYFLGKVKESQCIDQQLKLELATRGQKRDEPVSGFEDHPQGSKKVKAELLPLELQVIDFVYKFERPTSSKSRSLRCPHKSFEALLKVIQSTPESGPHQTPGEKKMRINFILERKKYPMIIVPEHPQAGNLSLANCQKFLVGGEYVLNAQLSNPHQRKVELEVTLKGKKILFDVTNNPSLLSKSDWDNVVAVFVQGRKNQFQDWAINQPSEIFRKAKGFFLRFPSKEDNLGSELSIKTYTIDKNVRYRDAEVKRAIWSDLEAFLYEKI